MASGRCRTATSAFTQIRSPDPTPARDGGARPCDPANPGPDLAHPDLPGRRVHAGATANWQASRSTGRGRGEGVGIGQGQPEPVEGGRPYRMANTYVNICGMRQDLTLPHTHPVRVETALLTMEIANQGSNATCAAPSDGPPALSQARRDADRRSSAGMGIDRCPSKKHRTYPRGRSVLRPLQQPRTVPQFGPPVRWP